MLRVNVEEITPIKKKMNVEVPEDLVVKEVDSFYRELSRKAKIKGFRPGKVPRNILERHFKDYVKAEVIQKLIQESYPQALSEAKLQPISNPLIDPGEMEGGKPFQYAATVEIKPEIKLEGYIGLKIEGKKEEVKDEEVEERLKNLQNIHAQLKTVSDPRPFSLEILLSSIMRRVWKTSLWTRARQLTSPWRLEAGVSLPTSKRNWWV
jgi:trigger factor